MLEKGAKVRVLGGPFTGRVGVVSELDGKGGARVSFGVLSARVPLEDLGPAGEVRGRPSLKSSHRRPAPSASLEDVRADATRIKKVRSPKRPTGR